MKYLIILGICLSLLNCTKPVLTEPTIEHTVRTDQEMCQQAHEAANTHPRKSAFVNEDGVNYRLPSKGECNSNGYCVINETITKCGVITIFMDNDGDGTPDYNMTFIPMITDDGKDVLFKMSHARESGFSI